MIKLFITSLAACTVALSSTPADAGAADWGNISAIYALSNGGVLFNSSGSRNGKPGCQGPGLEARWALDGSTVAGQAQVALLINAYNTRKRIIIVGQNSCSIWGDTETVAYFSMAD